MESVKKGDFSKVPLESIMYSGSTSNNPGQKYECEQKSSNNTFRYYLANWKNMTNDMELFTGLCVPQQCEKTDIEKALKDFGFHHSIVHDYPTDTPVDGLMIAAAVIFGAWIVILVLSSLFQSIKEPFDSELIKKNEEAPAPINASEVGMNSLVSEKVLKEE